MGVRPTWLIGLGPLGGATLAGCAAAVASNYGAAALHDCAWLTLDLNSVQPGLPKSALHLKLVERPRGWFNTPTQTPHPALATWFQQDPRASEYIKLERITRPENRQLQRLLFLEALVDTPDKLLDPLRLGLRHMRAHSRQRTQRVWIFGSMTEPALSAWYFDLANLLYYVAAKEGTPLSITLFAALPSATLDVSTSADGYVQLVDASAHAFTRELTRYSRSAAGRVPLLYPPGSGMLWRYNSQRVLADDIHMLGGDPTLPPSNAAAAATWVTTVLPLLDEPVGRVYLEDRENRHAAQPHLASDAPMLLNHSSGHSLHFDYANAVQRWTRQRVSEFLDAQAAAANDAGTALAGNLLEARTQYTDLTSSDAVQAPPLLWQLHQQQVRARRSYPARRALTAMPLVELLTWLNAPHLTPETFSEWDADDFVQVTPEALVENVLDVFATLGAPPVDNSNPNLLLRIRLASRDASAEYERALRGWVAHILQHETLSAACAAVAQLVEWLRPLPPFCVGMQGHFPVFEDDVNRVNRLTARVRNARDLVERGGLRRQWRFTQEARELLQVAGRIQGQVAYRTLWEQFEQISQAALRSTEAMQTVLSEQQDLLRAGAAALGALPQPPARTANPFVDPDAVTRAFQQRTNTTPAMLQGAWDWLWTIDGATAQLHLHIGEQRMKTGAALAQALLDIAAVHIARATDDVTLWDVWPSADLDAAAAHLAQLEDALAYNVTRVASPQTVTRRHWLVTARSRTPDAAYERARQQLSEAVAATLGQSVQTYESSARHHITLLRLDDNIMGDMLAYEAQAAAAYERSGSARQMALHILPGEVEAVRLEQAQRNSAALFRQYGLAVRSILAQPKPLQRLMHAFAFDMLRVDDDDQLPADLTTGHVRLYTANGTRDWLPGPISALVLAQKVTQRHPDDFAVQPSLPLSEAELTAVREQLVTRLINVHLLGSPAEQAEYLTDAVTWQLLDDLGGLQSPQMLHWQGVAAQAQLFADAARFFQMRLLRARDGDHADLWHALAIYAAADHAAHQDQLRRAVVAGG